MRVGVADRLERGVDSLLHILEWIGISGIPGPSYEHLYEVLDEGRFLEGIS